MQAAGGKKYVWAQPGGTRTLTDVLAVRGSLSGHHDATWTGSGQEQGGRERKKESVFRSWQWLSLTGTQKCSGVQM